MPVRYGSLPFEEAIAFFRQKLEYAERALGRCVADAHNRAFMVAGATKTDLLATCAARWTGDQRRAIHRCVSEGVQGRSWLATVGNTPAQPPGALASSSRPTCARATNRWA